MSFADRYASLNKKQQQAVDTIDGPVMVIAGPGTGKTELLSMRAANILQKTDVLPENILCLTFTDSGADAMRKRLSTIIGNDANKVAIHTFHSFGSDIMGRYGEYFYRGAQFRPADELSSYELTRGILDELDYKNPLASKQNGEFTYIGAVQKAISELKRSGLTSDELLQVLDSNDAVMDEIEPELSDIFARRIGASTLAQLIPISRKVAQLDAPALPPSVQPLTRTLALSLSHAIDDATAADSTKPITAWKTRWLENDATGTKVFKLRRRHEKLRALSYIYFQYLSRMNDAMLYDFDDMILRVVHAMEVFDDLRLNLQEQYQYIMVDEFQDTNLAQMRMLYNLTDNPANEGKPNILVVGDDDQAIYSFQGADVSNILQFSQNFPAAQHITLTENYRSGSHILSHSRGVITKGGDRLEYHMEGIDKTLSANVAHAGSVTLHEAETTADEREWLAREVAEKIAGGQPAETIAVLARRHSEIIQLLPYFAANDVPVAYERRDNVLESEPIIVLLQLSRLLIALHDSRLHEADALLPELMTHPAFGFATADIWKLSTKAYDSRTRWFEQMETMPAFTEFRAWLLEAARQIPHTPLEALLDTLIGKDEPEGDYRSPLFSYFFSDDALEKNPEQYLSYLEALRTIRTKLREYHTETTATLRDFVAFIELYEKLGKPLTSVHAQSAAASGVQLMTVHKAKGLEFDTVFVIGAIETGWGERARTRPNLISYPDNLPIAPAGESADERLRLFFVAMTRAKKELLLSYALASDDGKALTRAGFLLDDSWQASSITAPHTAEHAVAQAERTWYETIATPSPELRTLLQHQLETYKLSPTHVNAFTDITRGGPQAFLLNNLLHFPQQISPAAGYGTAIHAALQQAHNHLIARGSMRAGEDILHDFEAALKDQRLSDADYELYAKKGSDALTAFMAARGDTFSKQQKVEVNFAGQNVYIGDAHLTGKLDLITIDDEQKTIRVSDYKTGASATAWGKGPEYTKIKLHKYRQQLLFYKLLVEHSRDWRTYTVTAGDLQFVKPDKRTGEIVTLDLAFDEEELARFSKLAQGVWRCITTLSFPDTSEYPETLEGIIALENEIIDKYSNT